LTDPKGKKPTAAEARAVKNAIERGKVTAAAVCRARDLINEPAAYMTPSQMAAEATAIAKRHDQLSVTVHGAKKCAELGMGMFLAVGQGSEQESKLIHMVYQPAKKAKKKIALVGKGVTFDSGGLSLKPGRLDADDALRHGGRRHGHGGLRDAAVEQHAPAPDYEVRDRPAAENMVSGQQLQARRRADLRRTA
jgi:leucyl aminopeptidase